MENFAHLHPVAKTILFFNMWIGRLEVMTVLVFLQPHLWRTVRYRSAKQRMVGTS
jgi:Trk-type K+ transport system membrane component